MVRYVPIAISIAVGVAIAFMIPVWLADASLAGKVAFGIAAVGALVALNAGLTILIRRLVRHDHDPG